MAIIALAVALLVAPALRGMTAELNHTVGQSWPFSLRHCRTMATPGCDRESRGPEGGPVRATR